MLHGWGLMLLSCTGGREAIFLPTLPVVTLILLNGAPQLHNLLAAAIVTLGNISKV